MAMVREFSILIFLSLATSWQARSQQFSIVDEPVCWSIGGIDSSLTRATYVSVTGMHLTTFYINAQGASVDVSAGGNLSFGICNCCADVPPTQDAPYVDSISTTTCLIPVPPNIDSTCLFIHYLEIENVTGVSQVEMCLTPAVSPPLCISSVGYTSNPVGSITMYYTQAGPTTANVGADVWVYYPPNPAEIPITFTITVTTPNGRIVAFSTTII